MLHYDDYKRKTKAHTLMLGSLSCVATMDVSRKIIYFYFGKSDIPIKGEHYDELLREGVLQWVEKPKGTKTKTTTINRDETTT